MFPLGLRMDNDVIDVGQDITNINSCQDHFHQSGVRLWSIAQSKRHPLELELSERADKSGEGSISLRYGKVVIGPSTINGREDGTSAQLMQISGD